MNLHRSRPQITMALVGAIILSGALAIAAVLAAPDTSGLDQQRVQAGQALLAALLSGDDDRTAFYVTSELADAGERNCPSGQLSGCVAHYVGADWGNLLHVEYVRDGNSDTIKLYHAHYSDLNRPLAVVLTFKDQAGCTAATGWRGFVTSMGDMADNALLSGREQPNAFVQLSPS